MARILLAVALATIPTHVYKTASDANDAWVFYVIVHLDAQPVSASAELRAGAHVVKTITYSSDELKTLRGVRFKGTGLTAAAFANQDEAYDIRHQFAEPASLKIDRLVYTLRFADRSEQRVDIPLTTYAQKTKLIFPIKGNFIVINGWVTDRGHSERSQFYAYDITALGSPRFDLIKTNGETNADYLTWGREVIAPARGVVVYARNDVPDNVKPGTADRDALAKMPEPMWAVGGNCVVIDHGNGEFSFLAHMQHGSVRVKRGDTVEQGAAIGLLGNSGNALAPHLHYHLMAGPEIFRSDPLPSHFDNTDTPSPERGQYQEAK